MKAVIEKSFEAMLAEYRRLLGSFYPARDSTGFTEVNLVHVFVNCLFRCLEDPDAIAWFEFPWMPKTKHIDAIVYCFKTRTIFYIEGKRLSITSKKDGIRKDIDRIINIDRRFVSDRHKLEYQSEYIIILTDVWLEDRWKRAVPHWWTGNSDPEGFEGCCGPLIPSDETFPEYLLDQEKPIDWIGGTQLIKLVGTTALPEELRKYCLLLAYKRVSQQIPTEQ